MRRPGGPREGVARVSCHPAAPKWERELVADAKHVTVALAGNANVGKSVIFNHLTRSSQVIGNWPGKTVERAMGTMELGGVTITIVDLPGIYSLSTYSLEEQISRDYIAQEKPSVIVNVIGAPVLERNLYFTLQLLEMGVPMIVCLNQVDTAKKAGINIDAAKLETALGVPVVPAVAVKGEGLQELARKVVEVAQCALFPAPVAIKYDADLEEAVESLSGVINARKLSLPAVSSRWVAIKLLEGDPAVRQLVASEGADVLGMAEMLASGITRARQQPCYTTIAAARYALANLIASAAQRQEVIRRSFSERLDWITTHRVLGYLTSAGVLLGLLLWTFVVGDFLSSLIADALSFIEPVDPLVSGTLWAILWNGAFGGLVAGITLVIPFVIPFYLVLALLEDSGILTRVAFMMDSAMRTIGLNGKVIIPLILGYGCNVPAIYACRILETRRERILASFAITFAPCAARTIVILGLVAAFVGVQWALALYAVNIGIIFALGRVALRVVPGKSTGLIMEMHAFKVPSLSVVAKQTWARTKSIMYMVFPIYVVGSALVQALFVLGVLDPISNAMAPLTVWWLGLPVMAGVLLIFGAIRKEFILLMLVAIYHEANLALLLSPVQLVVLALVGMLYIPCLATIAALVKEFQWKTALVITLANLAAALFIGGIAYRLLSLWM